MPDYPDLGRTVDPWGANLTRATHRRRSAAPVSAMATLDPRREQSHPLAVFPIAHPPAPPTSAAPAPPIRRAMPGKAVVPTGGFAFG
jgi:hypothetical protein